jgi:hypothetical protein
MIIKTTNMKQFIQSLLRYIKRLRCHHQMQWVRNIHGDEINWCSGRRSVWECTHCPKQELRSELDH